MRQRLNPWALLITTALTFGSLMAFVGPHSVGYHRWGYRGYYDHHYQYSHRGCDGHKAHHPSEKTDTSSIR